MTEILFAEGEVLESVNTRSWDIIEALQLVTNLNTHATVGRRVTDSVHNGGDKVIYFTGAVVNYYGTTRISGLRIYFNHCN